VITSGLKAFTEYFIKQGLLRTLASAKAEVPPRARKRAVAARRARP
jgi:hypothetical protein